MKRPDHPAIADRSGPGSCRRCVRRRRRRFGGTRLAGRPACPGHQGHQGHQGIPALPLSETSNDRIVREKQVSGSSGQTDADAIERKIVTDVDMNIRVDDVNDAMEAVTNLVDTSGALSFPSPAPKTKTKRLLTCRSASRRTTSKRFFRGCGTYPSALNVSTGPRRT